VIQLRISQVVLLGACFAAPAHADQIFITPAGKENLDVIRLRLVPAKVRQIDGANPYADTFFHGIYLASEPPADPDAPMSDPKRWPTHRVTAFDPGGENRSDPKRLPGMWVLASAGREVDSLYDLRLAFSNRDQTRGIALGGRAYRAALNRALDPTGEIGLSTGGDAGGEHEADLAEGYHILSLSGRLEAALKDEQMGKLSMEVRRGLRAPHEAPGTFRGVENPMELIESIARFRRYRGVAEPGFDRAAFAMAYWWCQLGRVDPREAPPAQRDTALRIYASARQATEAARTMIDMASPIASGPGDDRQMTVLTARVWNAEDPEQRDAAWQAYEARREALRTGKAKVDRMRYDVGPLPVDASDLAVVAMELVRAAPVFLSLDFPHRKDVYADLGDPKSRVWLGHDRDVQLIESLLQVGMVMPGPSRRVDDRLEVRPEALTTLIHLMDPPPGDDPDITKHRAERGERHRRLVLEALADEKNRGVTQLGFEALMVTGFTPVEPATWLMERWFHEAKRAAKHAIDRPQWIRRLDDKGRPDVGFDRLQAREVVGMLAAVVNRRDDSEDAEAVRGHVLDLFEELADRVKEYDHPHEREVLRLWREAMGSGETESR